MPRYQYQELAGPVFQPAAAAVPDLSWLPVDTRRARSLPIIAVVLTTFWAAAYNPVDLAWQPRAAAPARALARAPVSYAVGRIEPPPVTYDPSKLEWQPSGRYPIRLPPPRFQDVFATGVPVYDPSEHGWMPRGAYPLRTRAAIRTGAAVIDPFPQAAAPAYDPRRLEWQSVSTVRVRRRPTLAVSLATLHAAAYDPVDLAWQPRAPVPARALASIRTGAFITDPRPLVAVYDPSKLEWKAVTTGRAQRPPRALRGDFASAARAYDPRTLEWLPTGRAPGLPLRAIRTSLVVSDPFPITQAPVIGVAGPGPYGANVASTLDSTTTSSAFGATISNPAGATVTTGAGDARLLTNG